MKQLKRGLAFLLVLVMVMGSMGTGVVAAPTAKTGKKAAVKTVAITKPDTKTLVMKKGQSYALKTKVTTSGKKVSKAVSYKSSNEKIVKVTKKGKLKALKNGKATITVTSKADKKKKATIKVVVKTPVTKVKLDRKEISLTEGETAVVTATVSPKKATIKKVSYKSSNKAVAKVNSKGKITAVAEGTAVITVTSKDGNAKKATCKVTVKKAGQTSGETPTAAPSDKPAPAPSDKPSETPKPQPSEEPAEKPDLSYEGYALKWEDDFNSVSLNSADWNVETHEPGWVNAELQEYVNSNENIYLENGNLVIKPVREKVGEDESGNPVYKYTSGRVNTQGKHDFTYGLFETRVKVPTGKGYLPAFWMMPTDENLYGQWPRCGEIDIMEVMGQETNKLYGTLHYGNPHSQKQETYIAKNGDFASEYHTYAVEWEPGKMIWYVDGIKYQEVNDWYTTTEGQGTAAYPAPFDQPFYMILNLAIGGSWVGYPDETTTYDDQAFVIDYVKAYQKDQSYYDELEKTVEKPEKAPVVEPEDGKYVKNDDFSQDDDLSGENGSVWKFMAQQGGEATACIVADDKFGAGKKAVKISTTKAGTENHSVQLVQAGIPVKQEGQYKLSFDAYAAADRTMIADVSAPDYNYARYLNDTVVNLTTEKQSYSYTFTVKDHDDANARIEFNLGKTSSVSDVYLSNVKLEKVAQGSIDTGKKVLTDGNCIYNGKFQEGTDRLAYWEVKKADGAQVSVTKLADGRRLEVVGAEGGQPEDVTISQNALPIAEGTDYILSFEAQADEATTIQYTIGGMTKSVDVTAEKVKYTQKFSKEEISSFADKDFAFLLGNVGKIYIDNVRFEEDALIMNGYFNAGSAGYDPFIDPSAKASWVIDSQSEKNAFDITIENSGDADWKIQLKQDGVTLEKGQWYKLSFDIKSSIARSITYTIQRNGNAEITKNDWTPYVQNKYAIETPNVYQKVSVDFSMDYATDTDSVFNIAMGNCEPNVKHRICIDNIELVKIDKPEEPKEPVEEGSNMLDNQLWSTNNVKASEDAGAVTVSVNAVGPDSWSQGIAKYDMPIEKGEEYRVSFDATSSVDRTIAYKVQEKDKDYTVYHGENIALKAGEKNSFTSTFTATASDPKVMFGIDLGKFGDEELDAHELVFSNVKFVKLVKAETGTEAGNIFKNADFSVENGKLDSWNAYIDDSVKNASSYKVEDGKIIYTVNDPGDQEWKVKLTQESMTLEHGKKYKLSFKAVSTADRKIKYIFQDPTDGKYTNYGGESINLTANQPHQVNAIIDVTDKETCQAIQFNVNMGIIDEWSETGKTTYRPETPAEITLSDFSLTEVK